ncbi:Hypothetical predicted protein [Mytilus galloprovincialis]|uniref:B box-type domain-containing protein n=1 Tax=Mytilus galloprovincialis TaxID=29158 RepID=A0A8B6HAP6_MYTGA|nr:Hypothetical predicted protein [Mytilus galloprovincialis]
MSDLIWCGPCGYADNNKKAEKWCTVCEEGLCADCEKVHKSIKTTRNHRLISTEDYRQIENISVNLNCKDHDKRFELYCKTHDVAVCLGCVPSHHMTCSDVIPLDKAAANAKQSTALADLEDTLTLTIQNLEQIIADRDSAAKKLEDQKKTIQNTINATRTRILDKLADLEQKLLHELDLKHNGCKSEESKLLTRLKKSKRDLSCLREHTSQLKSFASDIQLFLGTRQINQSVFREVESVKERIMSVQNYEMKFILDPSITALMNESDQFGKLSVKTTTTDLPFKEAKVDQAQIELRMPDTKDINNVRLQFKYRFEVKKYDLPMWLSGCAILPSGNLLIADYLARGVLMEYSEDGKLVRNIPCSDEPFDLTVIDNDRIAVTYGDIQNMEILNIKNIKVERKVKFEKDCYGISYQDNKLFISIVSDIVITDIMGKVLKTFNTNCGFYLTTTKDRIYFTRKSSVISISMTGETIWERTEKSSGDLQDITVDDHENVFVTDMKSDALIVIQHDGQFSRNLLTNTDGLYNPYVLHYNKDKKKLLVCNEAELAFLYNIVEC